jgi:hypothetical protein
MDPEVLQALGLPEDATTAQVLAAIEAQKAETTPPAPPEEGEETPDEGEEETESEGETNDTESLVEMAAKRGLVLVDGEGWKEVQAGAKAGRELAAARAEERRDSVLNDAIRAGKFPPARKEHFAQLYKADPTGTEELLAGMQGGIVPVMETGHAAAGEGEATEAYPDSWFPELAAAKAREHVPGTGEILNERKVVN